MQHASPRDPLGPRRFEFPNDQTGELFHAILALETVDDCEKFFRDLCTMQELKSLTERWHIARLIWQGYPYRTVIEKTGASSTTIARVAHWLTYGSGGYQRACTHLRQGKIFSSGQPAATVPAHGE